MYDYIVFDHEILNGKPIVKGTRLSVEFIMELFASGATIEEILKSYSQLNRQAVEEAIRYSANAVKNEILINAQITA
jgi:uncharacterized protein (DUF433 family)